MRVLAHELRNLIGTMRNAAHLIRLRKPSDAAILGAAQNIDRQIDAMLKLLERVVDAERIDRGDVVLEWGPVDVHAVILRAVDANRQAIEDRAQRVHITPSANAAIARSDEKRLVQVLSRLVSNASRFTPQGGEIWIGTEERPGAIRLHVRDNGAGMRTEFLPRVFVFFSASDRSGAASPMGLGIGLPAMHALMVLLEGNLEAFSEGPGRGSEFTVTLPVWREIDRAVHQGHAVPSRGGADPGPARTVRLTRKPRRILLVDDSAAVRESFADILQDMGYEVRTAGDGEDALRSSEAWRPDYVLLDINIPLLDGYEVARRLRAQFTACELKLVMTSGVTLDAATIRDAKQAGFDFCFDKAGNFSTLDAWLRQQDAG
jgi:CheY-like chemotaxis protein